MTATAVAPILLATPATVEELYVGQLLSQSSRVIVSAGTTIPVRYDEAERIIITPKETVPVMLIVAKNIRRPFSGEILIPADSQIRGELRPATGGSQFVAKELILSNSGQPLSMNAVSEIIAATATVTQKTKPNVFENAAIGAGAGAVLGSIFGGKVRLGEVLAGGGVGALVGQVNQGQKQVDLVEIDPDTDLHLFLRADLVRPR